MRFSCSLAAVVSVDTDWFALSIFLFLFRRRKMNKIMKPVRTKTPPPAPRISFILSFIVFGSSFGRPEAETKKRIKFTFQQ